MNYHVNPESGDPGPCNAKKQCPFGSPADHYATKTEARKAFEESRESFTVEERTTWLTKSANGQDVRLPKPPKNTELTLTDKALTTVGTGYTSFDLDYATSGGINKKLLNVTIYDKSDETDEQFVLVLESVSEMTKTEKKARDAYLRSLKREGYVFSNLTSPRFRTFLGME